MSSRINTKFGPVVIEDRRRTVHEHRYTTPIVREIPRPIGPDALDTSVW